MSEDRKFIRMRCLRQPIQISCLSYLITLKEKEGNICKNVMQIFKSFLQEFQYISQATEN